MQRVAVPAAGCADGDDVEHAAGFEESAPVSSLSDDELEHLCQGVAHVALLPRWTRSLLPALRSAALSPSSSCRSIAALVAIAVSASLAACGESSTPAHAEIRPETQCAELQTLRDAHAALERARRADALAAWAEIGDIANTYDELGDAVLREADRVLPPGPLDHRWGGDRPSTRARITEGRARIAEHRPALGEGLARRDLDAAERAGIALEEGSERVAVATMEARAYAVLRNETTDALEALEERGSELDDAYVVARDAASDAMTRYRAIPRFENVAPWEAVLALSDEGDPLVARLRAAASAAARACAAAERPTRR